MMVLVIKVQKTNTSLQPYLCTKGVLMQLETMSNDPLHGLTLEMIVTHLVESYGWDELGQQIRINCFTSNPSIQSSLKFLRKTPWARTKVEDFYKYSLRKNKLK